MRRRRRGPWRTVVGAGPARPLNPRRGTRRLPGRATTRSGCPSDATMSTEGVDVNVVEFEVDGVTWQRHRRGSEAARVRRRSIDRAAPPARHRQPRCSVSGPRRGRRAARCCTVPSVTDVENSVVVPSRNTTIMLTGDNRMTKFQTYTASRLQGVAVHVTGGEISDGTVGHGLHRRRPNQLEAVAGNEAVAFIVDNPEIGCAVVVQVARRSPCVRGVGSAITTSAGANPSALAGPPIDAEVHPDISTRRDHYVGDVVAVEVGDRQLVQAHRRPGSLRRSRQPPPHGAMRTEASDSHGATATIGSAAPSPVTSANTDVYGSCLRTVLVGLETAGATRCTTPGARPASLRKRQRAYVAPGTRAHAKSPHADGTCQQAPSASRDDGGWRSSAGSPRRVNAPLCH